VKDVGARSEAPAAAGTGGGVLFACLPAAGLINPMLVLADELARRGIGPIAFASTEERRGEVERLGGPRPVRFVTLGPFHQDWPDIWTERQLLSMSQGGRLRAMANFLDLNIDHEFAARQYARMLTVIDELRPRLMVVDFNTGWAIDAAMTRGIPYVASMPMPASSVFMERLPRDYPTPFSGLPRRMTAAQRRYNALFRLGLKLMLLRPGSFGATVAELRRRKDEGLANPTGSSAVYADGARSIIGYSTFDLEYEFPAVPDTLRMVGTMVPDEIAAPAGGSGLDDWLAEHGSVVYIGLGTIMRLTRGQIRAVLWKLGKSQQGMLPPAAELPANLRIEEWVPSQPAVLAHPHVKVFFNHAGGNAVHEGLHFGKPLLAMPFWTDCYDLAARIVDRGVGLAVPNVERPDVEQIVRSLEHLLSDEEYSRRARELGARLRAAGGVKAAVDVIEGCLG